jgi:hypothetical protein
MNNYPVAKTLFLFAAMATIGQAQLITNTQTNSYFATASTPANFQLSQWNFGGPLNSVTLNLSGAVTGFFSVENTGGSSLVLSNARETTVLTFSGLGAPNALQSSPFNLITSPSLPNTLNPIDPFDSQIFLVNTAAIPGFTSIDLTPYTSYFTGSGSLTLSVYTVLNIASSGPRSIQNGLNNSGQVTVTMVGVPEPSTWALLGLAAAASLLYARRCRA